MSKYFQSSGEMYPDAQDILNASISKYEDGNFVYVGKTELIQATLLNYQKMTQDYLNLIQKSVSAKAYDSADYYIDLLQSHIKQIEETLQNPDYCYQNETEIDIPQSWDNVISNETDPELINIAKDISSFDQSFISEKSEHDITNLDAHTAITDLDCTLVSLANNRSKILNEIENAADDISQTFLNGQESPSIPVFPSTPDRNELEIMIQDLRAQIKSQEDLIHHLESMYVNKSTNTLMVFLQKVPEKLKTWKKDAINTGYQITKGLHTITSDAYKDAIKVYNQVRAIAKNTQLKINKTNDKILDTITLGVYTKTMSKIQSSNFYQTHLPTLAKLTSFKTADYYKQIEQEIWPKGKSPATIISEIPGITAAKVKELTVKGQEIYDGFKDDVATAKDNIKTAIEDTKTFMSVNAKNATNMLHANSLGIQANVLNKLGNTLSNLQNKIETVREKYEIKIEDAISKREHISELETHLEDVGESIIYPAELKSKIEILENFGSVDCKYITLLRKEVEADLKKIQNPIKSQMKDLHNDANKISFAIEQNQKAVLYATKQIETLANLINIAKEKEQTLTAEAIAIRRDEQEQKEEKEDTDELLLD